MSLFEKTTVEVGKYKVARASGKDALLLAAMTRGDWSERVAVSARRGVDSVQGVTDELKRGGGFLLSRNGMPIGGAFYAPVNGSVWEIRRLGVVANFAGRGLTSLLLKAIEDSARRRAIGTLRMPVAHETPGARMFFEQHGYRVVNATTFITAFPSASKPIIMQKALN